MSLIITCPNAKGGKSAEMYALNCAASAMANGYKDVVIKSDAKFEVKSKVKVEVGKEVGKGIAHDSLVFKAGKEVKLFDGKTAGAIEKDALEKHNGLKNVALLAPGLIQLAHRIIAKSHASTGIGYNLDYIQKHAK